MVGPRVDMVEVRHNLAEAIAQTVAAFRELS